MQAIISQSGHIDYRHQLDRARRFLDRITSPLSNDVEFQDMVWSFFQHCWHVKDWLKNDPLATQQQKDDACKQAHTSQSLLICRDICNGTKHLNLTHPSSGAGASHHHVNITITPGHQCDMDCLFEDGHGNQISGKKLARDCIAEWERILIAQGLAISRLS